MWHFSATLLWILAMCHFVVANTQDTDIEVTLTRGTTGLGIHLVSEARGKGAVVYRVVPESAASLVLRAGDVLTSVGGVEVSLWYLDNINRLLGVHERIKLQLRRPPEPRLLLLHHAREVAAAAAAAAAEGQEENKRIKTASCYASVDGDNDDLHPFACAPTTYGGDLQPFSSDVAFPVAVAQPLEHCTRNSRLNATGFALLVSRGGCLPGVKAQNAASSGAEVVIMVEGQFPPFPPLPSVGAAAARHGAEQLSLRQQAASIISSSSSSHHHHQTTRNKVVDIPVLTIGNATGHRIISEVRDHGREVMILSHAGPPPSKSAPTPRKQIPLEESENLHLSNDAFNLKSMFRDGLIAIDFGEPGLARGKTATIFLQVPCQLSTLLTGEYRKIYFDKTIRCPVCEGRGALAAEMRPCKFCSSSGQQGISTAGHHHSREVEQTLRTTCTHCHGYGELPRKGATCEWCKGERVRSDRAPLDIHIPKGAPDRHTLHFPGIGSHLLGKTAGDVEISLRIEPHEAYTREGSNLRAELPISLTEALSGFTREVQLLNGTMVSLNKTGVTKHYDEIQIFGGGLPVWDPAAAAATAAAAAAAASRTKDAAFANLLMDAGQQASAFGSAILTCTVVFPANIGGRLKGLGGNAEEDQVDDDADY